jgi:hypothetical protein
MLCLRPRSSLHARRGSVRPPCRGVMRRGNTRYLAAEVGAAGQQAQPHLAKRDCAPQPGRFSCLRHSRQGAAGGGGAALASGIGEWSAQWCAPCWSHEISPLSPKPGRMGCESLDANSAYSASTVRAPSATLGLQESMRRANETLRPHPQARNAPGQHRHFTSQLAARRSSVNRHGSVVG